MSVVKRIVSWLGGKAAVYVVLVLAILASTFVIPRVRSELQKPELHLSAATRLEEVSDRLEAPRHDSEQRLAAAASAAQQKGVEELDNAIAAAKQARTAAIARRRGAAAKAISLARADTDALLKDGQLELEIQYLDREIEGLSAVRKKMEMGRRLDAMPRNLDAQLGQASAKASQAMAVCTSAQKALAEFEDRWVVRATLQSFDHGRHVALQTAVIDSCHHAAAAYADARKAAEALKRWQDLRRSYFEAKGWGSTRIDAVTADFRSQADKERRIAAETWPQRLIALAERHQLPAVLLQAAVALALIIATPLLIRLFCYFVLAPIAMRRPSVRLAGSGATAEISPAARSTTSVGVRLAAGEELLVRQGYLQSTSEAGRKRTQWLLDWRHPVSSLASGMSVLTCIRGEGEEITVSAVRDPFAEVTVLTVPEGTSCVLQPRALAAVAKPVGKRFRITSHWRLLSLNAWLTLQLRYLAFHGPARLVLKGGRGVRVEPAQRGRVLGKDQVIGFSTDLAYSVTRTETFWPYFIGRESLLKDRVAAGDGVVILEEAPMAGSRRPGEVRRGIEGMIDAGMKVFGW